MLRLCISRCLLGEPCRYDGRSRPLPPDTLPADAVLLPVCPEMEAGLGCPREPIELVGKPGSLPPPRVLGVTSRRDATPALRRACAALADALASGPPPDAFLLKERSPSCGLHTPLHDPSSGAVIGTSPGEWARTVLERFPGTPVFTEETFPAGANASCASPRFPP